MKTCCNGECKQGRDCPHRKVIPLHRVTELDQHFATGNTTGSAASDLLAMYWPTARHVNWGRVLGGALAVACAAFVVWLLAAAVQNIDLSALSSVPWGHQ